MAERGADDARTRRRKRRGGYKSRNRKREKLIDNLAWMAGGLAVGLPLLALSIYIASRF